MSAHPGLGTMFGSRRAFRGESPAAAILLAVAIAIFFRPLWTAGGDHLPGAADSMLNLSTMEKWFRWGVEGQGSWLGGGFFYPLQNTLGLTDAMFLMAIPYSLARWAGADPFTSYQLVFYGCVLLATLAFFLFLRVELGLSPLAAAAGVVPAALSNAMFISAGHSQLYSYAAIPVLLILAARFIRSTWEGRTRALLYGAGLAVLFPLFFFTGFYLAFFLGFFLLLMLALVAIVPPAWPWLRTGAARLGWARAIPLAVLAVASFTPFLMTYLPMLREVGPRAFADVVHTLPEWFDLANVSADNVVWGGVLAQWRPTMWQRPMYWELTKGMGLFTLLLFAMAWPLQVVACLRTRGALATPRWVILLAVAVGATVLVSWALMLRWNGTTAWAFVYAWIPGATALRAVFRFNLVLAFGVGIVIAVGMHMFLNRAVALGPRAARTGLILAIVAVAGLVAEQANRSPMQHVDKRDLRARLAALPAVPEPCRAFYLTWSGSSPPREDASFLNTFAMLAAQHVGLPTLNGHSSGGPKGWGLSFPWRPDYEARLATWIAQNRITEPLCALDLATNLWSVVRPAEIGRMDRMDGPLADGDFRFRARMDPPPTRMKASQSLPVALWIRNDSSRPWTSHSDQPDGRYQVRFAYQWIGPEGAATGFNNRWEILGTAKPGAEALVQVVLVAPPAPGTYTLEIDAVQEWVDFFRTRGNPTYRTTVIVE